ncbi:MAG: DUF86 domain-containing protein [Sciscionella sp.]|nr:DUF86 domain-containing protein [Sciscionella sp.]
MTKRRPNLLLEKLAAARVGIRAAREIVNAEYEQFENDSMAQRALAYCWVTAGSALKDYQRTAGMTSQHPVFTQAIGFRDKLAHRPLDELDPEIIWNTTVHDAPELLSVVEAIVVGTEPRLSS